MHVEDICLLGFCPESGSFSSADAVAASSQNPGERNISIREESPSLISNSEPCVIDRPNQTQRCCSCFCCCCSWCFILYYFNVILCFLTFCIGKKRGKTTTMSTDAQVKTNKRNKKERKTTYYYIKRRKPTTCMQQQQQHLGCPELLERGCITVRMDGYGFIIGSDTAQFRDAMQ